MSEEVGCGGAVAEIAPELLSLGTEYVICNKSVFVMHAAFDISVDRLRQEEETHMYIP
jgi:hypothetical protein